MDFKFKREKELLVHKVLYKTVSTLTLFYPTSSDFKIVFKEDMFMKNNKAGFLQVMYYLLNILDSEKLKLNVQMQPPYDIRTETQFRTFVLKYVNDLNLSSDNANIPQVAMSQLISPSGIKFLKFMLKLAQLALFKHLQTVPSLASKMLLQVKPSTDRKVASENLLNLQSVTHYIYGKCNEIEGTFRNDLANRKIDAAHIIDQQSQNTKLFKENQQRLKALETRTIEKFRECQYTELIKGYNIQDKLEALLILDGKVKEYNRELAFYLSSKYVQLEHDVEVVIPLYKKCNDEKLDLIDFFRKFIKVLDHQRLKIMPLSNKELMEQTELFQNLNERLAGINKDILTSFEEYSRLCESYEDGIVEAVNLLDNALESTPLATPLPQSPLAEPLPQSPAFSWLTNQ